MVHAFVMVKTAAGTSESLLEGISAIEAVVDAHIVAGTYDIIAEIDVAEVYEVMEVVSTGIQGFEDVEETKTYIGLS